MTNTPTPELSAAQVAQDYRALARRLSKALLRVRPLGGSELFIRVGDEFFADPEFCQAAIEELHQSRHEAMKRAVKAEKALDRASRPSAPALVQALREIEEFTSKANGGLDGVLNFICKKALSAHPASSTGVADQGSPGPEWRDIISAPRNGEVVKLAWWVGNQWVSTHGRYLRSHDCWVDEENFRLDPKMWAPADQGSDAALADPVRRVAG